MFADVSGSTELYRELGDEQAFSIISKCVNMLITEANRSGGTVVKTIGDEILTHFHSVDDAANAAMSMQRVLADQPTAVRIGFHHGPVIFSGADIFGDVVNLAARIAGKANGDEIVTTEFDVLHLTGSLKESARRVRKDWVKGIDIPITFFEIIWWGEDEEDQTLLHDESSTKIFDGPVIARLTVTFRDRKFTLDPAKKVLLIGRTEENNLVVNDRIVSKRHAEIRYVQNAFTLSDNSANGTYVMFDGHKEPVRLRKWDIVQLEGVGWISLGILRDSGSDWLIHFDLHGGVDG
jgi:hypothetical protein|tara:strand:+ start:246 stop:1124 length:879 start_codon:yes stop_codon:yes gene_type:complete